MPQIGPLEILVVAALALIVFGPDRLPEVARSVGRGLAELRRMATEVRSEFEGGLDVGEDDDDGGDRPAQTEPPGTREER